MVTPKKYICRYCARAFTRSEHKQRHERSHTNEKPFGCQFCSSAFVRRDLLQRHCRTVHNVRLTPRPRKESTLSDEGAEEPHLTLGLPTEDLRPPGLGISLGSAILSLDLESPGKDAAHSPLMSRGQASPALAAKCPTSLAAKCPTSLAAKCPEATPPTAVPKQSPAVKREPETPALPCLLKTPVRVPESPLAPPSSAPLAASTSMVVPYSSLLHLVALARLLETVFDASDAHLPLVDFFAVGAAMLVLEPCVFAPVHHSILKTQSATGRLCVAYTVLAVGALSLGRPDLEALAASLVNKAWGELVGRVVPKNTLAQQQADVLQAMYLLAYAYMRHFANGLMVPYLEELAAVIVQNLAAAGLVQRHLDVLWAVYVLVLKSRAHLRPPVLAAWFHQQKLKGASLRLHAASRTPHEPVAHEVVVCALVNEANLWHHNHALLLFADTSELRDAVLACAPADPDPLHFQVTKERLLEKAPRALEGLVRTHVRRVAGPRCWLTLLALLRTAQPSFDFDALVRGNTSLAYPDFANALLPIFANEHLNDPLAAVGILLIFNARLLHMKPVDLALASLFDLAALDVLLVEWSVQLTQLLVQALKGDTSPLLHCLVYLVTESDHESLDTLHVVFAEVLRTCDTWMEYAGSRTRLGRVCEHLRRFLSDLFMLALNSEAFDPSELAVTNGLLFVAKSRSGSLSLPNYVLYKGPALPPLHDVTTANLPKGYPLLPPIQAIGGRQDEAFKIKF